MTEKRRNKKYIEEQEFTIDFFGEDLGITFFSGSSPPRIQKVDILSFFTGMLRVGDEVVQIDKKQIKTEKDFIDATHNSGKKNKVIRLRCVRDNYYSMAALKVSQIKKNPNHLSINLQIRWRKDIPVGIIVEKKGDYVTVMSVEPNSVASLYIQEGDIVHEVNERGVSDITEAKKAIRQGIVEKNTVKLKIERRKQPPKLLSTPAEDVLSILKRHAGFWNRQYNMRAIDDEEGGRTRVYHMPNIESETLPVDETGKELVPTPSRDGGTHVEEPAAEVEEEATEEEEV